MGSQTSDATNQNARAAVVTETERPVVPTGYGISKSPDVHRDARAADEQKDCKLQS